MNVLHSRMTPGDGALTTISGCIFSTFCLSHYPWFETGSSFVPGLSSTRGGKRYVFYSCEQLESFPDWAAPCGQNWRYFPSHDCLAEQLHRHIFPSPACISCPELELKKFQRTSNYLFLLHPGDKSDGETPWWCQHQGNKRPNNCPLANTFRSIVVGLNILDKHALLLLLARACFSTLAIWALLS